MDRAKYIILDNSKPIIFSAEFNHSDIANMVGRDRVTSAGFVQFHCTEGDHDIDAIPYGESMTLKLKPDERDRMVLTSLCKHGF